MPSAANHQGIVREFLIAWHGEWSPCVGKPPLQGNKAKNAVFRAHHRTVW